MACGTKSPLPPFSKGGKTRLRFLELFIKLLVQDARNQELFLDHDLVHRYILFSRARQNFLDAVDDVMGHERLAVIFSDMAVGDEAGLGAQVTGELAAIVVLDDDGFLALRPNRIQRLTM